MQLLGKIMVARRENVTSPLEFRFTGGDDRNMNWMQVQVIDPPEPPAVRSLTLKVTPPGYTNWPEEDREATSPRPLLAGSRVQLAGKATKRLKPASRLRFDDGRELAARDRRRRPDVPRGKAVARGIGRSAARADRGEIDRLHVPSDRRRRRRGRRR